MSRTLEIDWQEDHTTIVEVDDNGKNPIFCSDSTDGRQIVRIIDPDGGPDWNQDEIQDFISLEL